MITLTESIVSEAKRRYKLGESLKVIAGEVGVTWQKLDKAIRHGLSRKAESKAGPDVRPETAPAAPLRAARPAAGLLTDKYRPARLDGLFGQDKPIALLRRFVAQPHSCAFLFEGETGTGKSSAALALAAELGCRPEQAEFGGVHVIASGEQSAEAVREVCEAMWRTPFYGSGWKVVIVNEVDRMNAAAETIWLDRLESLPARTVVVFTTNFSAKLSARFRDRCVRMTFDSDPARLRSAARSLVGSIWKAETGKGIDRTVADRILADAVEAGALSFRRLVQLVQLHLMERRAS